MRRITVKQIAMALGMSEQAIHLREGKTIPLPLNPNSKPHEYDLRAVLCAVSGAERDRIAARCGYQVTIAISERELKEFNPQHVPSIPDDDEDESLQEDAEEKRERKRDRFF